MHFIRTSRASLFPVIAGVAAAYILLMGVHPAASQAETAAAPSIEAVR